MDKKNKSSATAPNHDKVSNYDVIKIVPSPSNGSGIFSTSSISSHDRPLTRSYNPERDGLFNAKRFGPIDAERSGSRAKLAR